MAVDLAVIGGGATGASVARDAAMRGLSVALVERGPLASGTTGRFHGQLHSGARYAVQDPVSAAECASESAILRRIAAPCIEDTGGVFVVLGGGDDSTYAEAWCAACGAAGIAVEELPVAVVLRAEPALTRAAVRAFAVQDAVLDARKLVDLLGRAVAEHGGRVLTGRGVTGLIRGASSAVAGVEVEGGEVIEAQAVVNAAGAWAGRVAAMAGGRVPIRLSKGVMVAAEGCAVSKVVSRCRMPSDGDILVPFGGRCLMGTTDEPVSDPDDLEPDAGAVARMAAAGDELVPGFSKATPLQSWAAIRPLLGSGTAEPGRSVPRSHRLIDHGAEDGIDGLLTIIGGKATTCRLMAEETVDAVCRLLGSPRLCRTAGEPLPSPTSAKLR